MALFIFLAVLQAVGCSAPVAATLMAEQLQPAVGWGQGSSLPAATGRLRWDRRPLPPQPGPWLVLPGGPQGSKCHWWELVVAAALRLCGQAASSGQAALQRCRPGGGQGRAAPGPPHGAGLWGGFRGPLALT